MDRRAAYLALRQPKVIQEGEPQTVASVPEIVSVDGETIVEGDIGQAMSKKYDRSAAKRAWWAAKKAAEASV